MKNIKDSFDRVKKDIEFLSSELGNIKNNLNETKTGLIDVCTILKNSSLLDKKFENQDNKINKLRDSIFELKEIIKNNISMVPTIPTNTSTDRQIYPTIPTNTSTDSYHFKPLSGQIQAISIGNQGVQTDRQTHQQTVRQTGFAHKMENNNYQTLHQNIRECSHNQNIEGIYRENIESNTNYEKNSIKTAVNMIESLDKIKKELRLKFKRLTEQEILVFSTIYQLDEELGHSDYKILSERLKLTQSSIRDYVGRLIKKGILIDKIKINNKQIQLNISSNLKRVASLPTILELRDL